MAGRFLLDTNIVVAFFNGEEPVQEQMDDADDLWLCSIVIGELLFGARKSGREAANVQRVESLKYAVLPCDAETAHHFAIVKNRLRVSGQPIPENDVWIAACALQGDLTLVTRDAHFGVVAGLKTENW